MLNVSRFSTALQNVIKDLGFQEFTPIQDLTFPVLLEKKNALIISATGSGKTEAAVLPVFDQLMKKWEEGDKKPGINILYITSMNCFHENSE